MVQGDMPNMANMPMPMSNDTMMNMVMQMSFYWGKDVVILFKDWPNGNIGMYILALIFVFVVAAALEILFIASSFNTIGTSPVVGGSTQALIYALRMTLGYLVMLSVMSYNLGVFIVAIAGHAFGFFLVKYRAIAQANANNTPKV